MRIRFECVCCKEDKFFLDGTSFNDLCASCYHYLINSRKIPRYVLDFIYKYDYNDDKKIKEFIGVKR